MRILGIESSCDDSAIALYDDRDGLVAHKIFSQVDLHALYGGVVPELASREHLQRLLPLLDAVLNETGAGKDDIDAIAYTAGPGLIGSLLVGACVASGLSLAWGKPLIPVHHLEAHLLAAFLEKASPSFPFCTLLISGGHTMLIHARALGDYELLGETLDDAVGEAFDKTAKMMGLPYPGGPVLSELARQGDATSFKLTRPMVNRPGLDFSFSGLKTQVLTAWQGSPQTEADKVNLAASFQRTIAETLEIKLERARQAIGFKELVVAGGVGANWEIRERLAAWAKEKSVSVFFPRIAFCTDNAAMVAYAGMARLQAGLVGDETLFVKARWPLEAKPSSGSCVDSPTS